MGDTQVYEPLIRALLGTATSGDDDGQDNGHEGRDDERGDKGHVALQRIPLNPTL